MDKYLSYSKKASIYGRLNNHTQTNLRLLCPVESWSSRLDHIRSWYVSTAVQQVALAVCGMWHSVLPGVWLVHERISALRTLITSPRVVPVHVNVPM